MQVTKQDISALNAVISLTVEKSDYEADYVKKLKKQQSEGQFKGFRKGKAPMAFVKKMYGGNALIETVNGKMQEQLYKYIQEEKLNILGDPLMTEDQEQLDFNHKDLQDYTFKFEIGVAPEIKVKGIASSDSYPMDKVDVEKKMVDEEIAAAVKKFGDMKEVSTKIQEGDRVALSAYEMDGKKAKKDGHESTFTVFTNDVADEYKDELYKLKQGATIAFDIYKLEKDKDEAFVQKYLLKLEGDALEGVNSTFEAVIDTVTRLEESKVDQSLFDKMFGEGAVDSEKAFRAKIKEEIAGFYDQQSTNLMYRGMMESLIEKNQFELPSAFLMKWLKWTNEETPVEELEKGFKDFEDNLRWTLIKAEIGKKYEVKVEPDEVKAYITNQVLGYMGAYASNPQFVDQMVGQVMQDKKQVQNAYGEIEAKKIFSNLQKDVTVVENSISIDDFKELVKSAQQQG